MFCSERSRQLSLTVTSTFTVSFLKPEDGMEAVTTGFWSVTFTVMLRWVPSLNCSYASGCVAWSMLLETTMPIVFSSLQVPSG